MGLELARLGRTLRHLRAGQLVAQVGHRVRRRLEDPARLVTKLPADGEVPRVRWAWRADVATPHPDGVPMPPEEVRRGCFTFLGETRELGRPVRWRDEQASRVWRYHLQDHGFLFGLDFEAARGLVLEYLDAEPPSRAAEGWEPYPLSLRLSHWVCLFFGRWRTETEADGGFARRLWLELRRMAHWLVAHPETHLSANHLLENTIALALFGACFEGDLACRVAVRAEAWLRRELAEQVLHDGGHVERSPMYQARLLFGLGLLLQSGDRRLRERVAQPAARMLAWLGAMTHPDGDIALFNDAALDVYPRHDRLLPWLERLGPLPQRAYRHGPGWAALEPSGYYAGQNGQGDLVLLDAGEIGPDHQPGHAHADFLSLEASLGGRRFCVDGGNFDYLPTPERRWSRGVAAHSTVFVQGHEPLELWGAFRVGRRGRPLAVRHAPDGAGGFQLRASHTGYDHLRGRPRPERVATWRAGGCLTLLDRVHSARVSRVHACQSQLRIDGAWRAQPVGEDRVRFEQGGLVAWVLGDGPLTLREGSLLSRASARSVRRTSCCARSRATRPAWPGSWGGRRRWPRRAATRRATRRVCGCLIRQIR